MQKIDIKQGNCLELMKDIPDKSIDMILCDLPYGTTKNRWDSVIPFEPLWKQYNRVIKDNGAIVLFSQQPFTSALVGSNLKNFRYEWIWVKSNATGFLNAKKMPLKKHENILIFYKKLPTYNPQGLIKKDIPTIRKGRNNGSNYGESSKDALQEFENYPTDILFFASEGKTVHPTQKPVALLEYLIRTYTNEGEVVLDSCMGSGSTGVAAINTNRRFIGMELNERYFEIAEDRINKAREDALDLIKRQQLEIERLKDNKQIEISERLEKEIRSEAIKEFAERLKDIWFDNSFDSPDIDFDYFIDNIVKEMINT